MATDWAKSLTFSDRLSSTSRIAAAYKTANSACSPSGAAQHARISEETARKNALSLEEYHDLVTKSTQLLLSSQSPPQPGTLEDHHADEHVFPNLPHTGARIGRYLHAEHYKDGLFSEVFKALAAPSSSDERGAGEKGGKLVALKITNPDLVQPPHDSHREARILMTVAQGKRCPNIVPLLETFHQPGGHFVLAFPFLPYDLSTLLRTHPQLATSTRKCILQDLFTALSHLHITHNIIHRDVKPSNILLRHPIHGPAYLSDFGIAWSSSDSASEAPDAKILDVGTTAYRPPELLFGNQTYGTKLDMWAAGCTAAQVVCDGLGPRTLFEAGELGSELGLIRSMFEELGTPDLGVWPEAATFPDWGKMNFTKYPGRKWEEILEGADPKAADLVSRLVVYESGNRLSAKQALAHKYLQS